MSDNSSAPGIVVGLPNPGPFKWFTSPLDPELLYRTIYKYYSDQDKVIQLWNLPGGHGPIVQYYDRDGVLILMADDGDVCFVQQNDIAQGDVLFYDRYVYEPRHLYLDGIVAKEEQDEINKELEQIQENVKVLELARKHERAVQTLRAEATLTFAADYEVAKQALDMPGLTKTQIAQYVRELRQARLQVKFMEDVSEGKLFEYVKNRRLDQLQSDLGGALALKVLIPVLLPGGGRIVFREEGEPEVVDPTQDELDVRIGRIYRKLKQVEACETPEDLSML